MTLLFADYKSLYFDRMADMLQRQIEVVRKGKYAVDPSPTFDQPSDPPEMHWSYWVYFDGKPGEPKDRDLKVTFKLIRGEHHGGPKAHIAFMVEFERGTGENLGGISLQGRSKDGGVPDSFWISMDHRFSVEKRMTSFENTDPKNMVDVIRTHLEWEEKGDLGGEGKRVPDEAERSQKGAPSGNES